MMYAREESEYFRARMKAARRIYSGQVKPYDLPSQREIRDQIRVFARVYEGRRRSENLRQMRVAALRMMEILRAFRPRLIGSTLTGHARQGSQIDLQVFSDSVDAVAALLEIEGIRCEIDRRHSGKVGQEQALGHIRAQDRFPFELTIYPADMAQHVFKSAATGRAVQRASINQLEELMEREHADGPPEQPVPDEASRVDRFRIYETLLLPLEHVKESPVYHPEGDALYHSLQVFELIRNQLPYDEELLLAALLHDVGKAIDAKDHVAATLETLDGHISPRTAWLIEHHVEAQDLLDGSLGVRPRRRLEVSESFHELMLLAECDRQGRAVGVRVPDVEEALQYVRSLAEACGE